MAVETLKVATMDQSDLQAMMKELCLDGDYLDVVVFESEVPQWMEAACWMTIAG